MTPRPLRNRIVHTSSYTVYCISFKVFQLYQIMLDPQYSYTQIFNTVIVMLSYTSLKVAERFIDANTHNNDS